MAYPQLNVILVVELDRTNHCRCSELVHSTNSVYEVKVEMPEVAAERNGARYRANNRASNAEGRG